MTNTFSTYFVMFMRTGYYENTDPCQKNVYLEEYSTYEEALEALIKRGKDDPYNNWCLWDEVVGSVKIQGWQNLLRVHGRVKNGEFFFEAKPELVLVPAEQVDNFLYGRDECSSMGEDVVYMII